MFARRNPTYGNASSSFQKYVSIDCTQKYNNYKNEIEQKISQFKNRKRKIFNEWNGINKFIIDKNNEIAYCVRNNYISVNFYGDPDIKNFSEICTSDRKCNFNKTQAKKTFEPKTVKKGTCTGERNCEKQAPSVGAEKIKSETRPLVKDTITVSSSGPDLKGQRQKAADGQESQNANISTQPQPSITNPASPVVPNVEVPEESANPDFRSSGPKEAQKQTSDVSDPPNEDILGTEPRNSPLQTVLIQESNPGDFSQEKGTDKNVLQSKLPSDNTNGANPIGHQANVDPVVQKENLVAPLPSTHIHDTVSDVERDHSDGNSDNGVSTSVSYNVLDRVNGTSLGQPADEVPTSADSIVADTTDSVQFDSKGVGGADIGKLVIDSEHARVKTPCSEMPSTQAIHNGDSCIKEQDNELVHNNDNNLGIFNDIYQMILSNKDNMTNASIPIGIVLLLSLLFKYTSWWSLLTKKKRKKPAEMNQELHSVLQVPSIFDEERSIAFSYGAFEYSS
ncbi:hypothetical protein, conserved [Plasmodium vivax]|uniref:VIR protein n=1 Tax=Plasmodium vivax TaxID=5855 RepID=A0A1G4EBX0_PLAVI|nr:hypothetical protein, conserved [Plasmodium vivax]